MPTYIGAIVSLTLLSGVKFDITCSIIQLLNMKGVFASFLNNDKSMHLINFIGTFTSYNLPGVNMESLRIRLFPFSLTAETILLLGELHRRSITTNCVGKF